MFGILTGLFKFIFDILKAVFGFIESIFNWIKYRIQFIIDAVDSEVKFEKTIKRMKSQLNRERRLNDEM
jgi:phage-related protein